MYSGNYVYVYASWIDPFDNSTSTTQTKGNSNGIGSSSYSFGSGGGGGYKGGTLYYFQDCGLDSKYPSYVADSGSSYVSGYDICKNHSSGVIFDNSQMIYNYKYGNGNLYIKRIYECGDFCFACNEDKCLKCIDNYYLYQNICVDKCPMDFVPIDGECIFVPKQTETIQITETFYKKETVQLTETIDQIITDKDKSKSKSKINIKLIIEISIFACEILLIVLIIIIIGVIVKKKKKEN